MRIPNIITTLAALAIPVVGVWAAEPQGEPDCVVEQWSDVTTSPLVLDINFSDATWPDTWTIEHSGMYIPEWEDGAYVNAVLPAGDVAYPIVFHNVAFANRNSFNGMAAATAAFCRQYYEGSKATNYNDWKSAGHTVMLEEDVEYNANGKPVKGIAGFAQMCRGASPDGVTSLHGWIEIDHIPYVDRLQWSWSNTSWGRGIKCDIKIGDGDWTPLVWMGSEKQKQGWTLFSDQGYFMDNVIDAYDVSLRWRIWDGDGKQDEYQVQEAPFDWQAIDPLAQRQGARLHKVKIYGTPLTQADADNARANMVNDPGELTDLSKFDGGTGEEETPPEEKQHILAFPTAEGFGKYSTGGRGGRVVTVTSLADDGSEGTLRWAFNQYKDEPITIVFAVNGLIRLNSELRVNRANWTLAGQSAPGEGITIGGAKVNFGGSQNFIVRNMRFRAGSRDAAGNVLAENAVAAENCALFIFDHCSFGWSVEENMNTQDAHFITVQYSIVHEGLYNAGHPKGARGYGAQWGGSPATYHHNLLAHNNSRSPRINGARGEDQVVFLEYINNVNYNYGKRGGCYGGENTAPLAEGAYDGLNSAHDCNFMNNYYKPGPYSSSEEVTFVQASYQRDGSTSWAPSQWWIDGNFADGFPEATADNTKAVTAEGYALSRILASERIVTATPWYRHAAGTAYGSYVPAEYMLWDIESAEQAYATVLAKAGPVVRDQVDTRIANEALTGTVTYKQGVIDLETEAEGFFDYTAAEAPVDTDGDGMPDAWEACNNLDPSTPDNNARNSEGYTAIEIYLNSLMGEVGLNDFSGVPAVVAEPVFMTYDASSSLLHCHCADGTTVKVYALDGALMLSMPFRDGNVSVAPLAGGTYIAIAETAIPSVLKFIR